MTVNTARTAWSWWFSYRAIVHAERDVQSWVGHMKSCRCTVREHSREAHASVDREGLATHLIRVPCTKVQRLENYDPERVGVRRAGLRKPNPKLGGTPRGLHLHLGFCPRTGRTSAYAHHNQAGAKAMQKRSKVAGGNLRPHTVGWDQARDLPPNSVSDEDTR